MIKDSKTCDSVAKALLFVSKFSRDQALLRFSDSSISIIWGGTPKTYFINSEVTSFELFKHRPRKHSGIDHVTVVQVNPSALGRLLKQGNQERDVTVLVHRGQNKLQVLVENDKNAQRTLVHTLNCEIKSLDEFNNMLIEKIEHCRYDTTSYVDNIHRFKHIVSSLDNMKTAKIYIWSRHSHHGNDLTITAKTQGSTVCVSLSDLDAGDDNEEPHCRQEAGVQIDTRKLAIFLSGLSCPKKAQVKFEIEHNKCLKVTYDNESSQGERSYQSLLLIHSLNR